MKTYLRNSKLDFGKYNGKKLSEVWNEDQSYVTEFMLKKAGGFFISDKTLDELKDPKKIKMIKYCYKGYIDEFLSYDQKAWLSIMEENYGNNRGELPEQGIINSWVDCFNQLQIYLEKYKGKRYYLIFEYELELGSGRRPDVILLIDKDVLILEFKEKDKVMRKDILQLQDYSFNISNYHIESRGKRIIPVLVETRLKGYLEESNITICSPDRLELIIDKLEGNEITYDPLDWINSLYEPLPTIVESARMIMDKKELPQIKQAKSAGIPEALEVLKKTIVHAKEKSEHILAIVTGVPGAGKTLLGLKFTYGNYETVDNVNSIYISGNNPLVRVLQSALESDVFVKDLHEEIDKFYYKGAKFNKNIIVFDEGQRSWDEKKVRKRYPELKGFSQPELVINMVEKNSDWNVLLLLVGEGQKIHIGEEKGIDQWNEALSKSEKNWKVLCPEKIETYFPEEKLITDTNRSKLDLKISLRSKLAGQVSEWVNEVLDSNISKAKKLAEDILRQNFHLLITKDLSEAKNFFYDKYGGLFDKRYGIITSSKSSTLETFGINKPFDINYADWYNNPLGGVGSCCNFSSAVTEFGCQGLELDLPVLVWGDDMIRDGEKWKKYSKKQAGVNDPHQLRLNSYRVLMTRGRDGLIVVAPNESVFNVLVEAGMEDINNFIK